MTEEIEIPFGAFDSETIGWTYTIPEGFTAKIEDGKIIVEKKESDDEKIRKEIVDYFNQYKEDGIRGVDITPWIAYLEKQKEQKPTVNIDNFKSFMMQYLQDAANRKTDSEIEADTDKWAKKLLNLIEVKEQKPAEWSEEDEKMKQRILTHLYSFIYPNSLYAEDASECISWLKSLRPQPQWKPSEEQLKALRYVAYHLMPDENYRDEMFLLYEQLKKL